MLQVSVSLFDLKLKWVRLMNATAIPQTTGGKPAWYFCVLTVGVGFVGVKFRSKISVAFAVWGLFLR